MSNFEYFKDSHDRATQRMYELELHNADLITEIDQLREENKKLIQQNQLLQIKLNDQRMYYERIQWGGQH